MPMKQPPLRRAHSFLAPSDSRDVELLIRSKMCRIVQGGTKGAGGEERSSFVPLSGLPAGSWLCILVVLRQMQFWHCVCPVCQQGAF